jgi:leucyl-tRNA synthetase
MSTDQNPPSYEPGIIEPKWQKKWLETKAFAAKDFDKRPSCYVLETFPYPSGAGLHLGHCEGYTASDIFVRFKRTQGSNVMYTMGWDAFGLPAEQFALKTGQHPSVAVEKNVATYTKQLKSLGFSYDWDREINTTDPKYYKWTQWIFLKLFEKGLAYVDRRPVWWCPELKTVLANEEIIDGKSEVGGFPVERKFLLQWVLKITAYADSLLAGLKDVNWAESTRRMQEAWIGRSEGAEISFDIEGFPDDKLIVYTTRPDTLFGVTFMVIAPEHPLVDKLTTSANKAKVEAYVKAAASKSDLDRTELNKDKTGVFTGSYAINPASGRKAQIWVGDYALGSYGTGAIIAVPAHDERDYDFAQKHGIEIVPVIEGPNKEPLPYTGTGKMINSSKYDGMDSEVFKKKIVEDLAKIQRGKPTVNYKLRDWLFSRQRYWGEPFPILWISDADYRKIDRAKTKLVLPAANVSYSENGKIQYAVGLPFDNLPLKLPEVDNYKPSDTGESPLAHATTWVNVYLNITTGETHDNPQCQNCVPARRETNTMPQWAGSCWYYLRYIDPHNSSQLIAPEKEKYWGMPQLYINGAEHAVLHLLYARFWHHFLFDIGVLTHREPFPRVVHQGIVLGEDNQKMAKSRPDFVVLPDTVIKEYGADTLRLYLMFMGPLEDMKPWSSKGIEGVHRFLRRSFREIIGEDGKISAKIKEGPETNAETEKLLHATIKKVSADIENLRFNTAISALMILLNQLQAASSISLQTASSYVQLLAPFAPHLGEELWEKLGGEGSVGEAPWPSFDESKLVSSTVKIVVQVNGKLRAELELPTNVDETKAVEAAKANEKVKPHLEGKTIRKVVFVKGRLLNLVVG